MAGNVVNPHAEQALGRGIVSRGVCQCQALTSSHLQYRCSRASTERSGAQVLCAGQG